MTSKPRNTDTAKGVAKTGALNQTTVVKNNSIALLGSKFKIGKKIGSGNFGEVRMGKNVTTNEDVAVKTVF